jgi:hypothetical protein
MSLPSVLIKKSTGEIIKHANYPRADMGVIEGLDPDLEWLLKYEPFIRPEYDSRIYILRQVEEVTATPHPQYAHLNQYKITHETEKRPSVDIEKEIQNAEQDANLTIIPHTKQLKLLALGVGVLFRALDGLTLTPKETAIKAAIIDKAVKLWKNDSNLRLKITQLTQGLEPNIDAGWEKEA